MRASPLRAVGAAFAVAVLLTGCAAGRADDGVGTTGSHGAVGSGGSDSAGPVSDGSGTSGSTTSHAASSKATTSKTASSKVSGTSTSGTGSRTRPSTGTTAATKAAPFTGKDAAFFAAFCAPLDGDLADQLKSVSGAAGSGGDRESVVSALSAAADRYGAAATAMKKAGTPGIGKGSALAEAATFAYTRTAEAARTGVGALGNAASGDAVRRTVQNTLSTMQAQQADLDQFSAQLNSPAMRARLASVPACAALVRGTK